MRYLGVALLVMGCNADNITWSWRFDAPTLPSQGLQTHCPGWVDHVELKLVQPAAGGECSNPRPRTPLDENFPCGAGEGSLDFTGQSTPCGLLQYTVQLEMVTADDVHYVFDSAEYRPDQNDQFHRASTFPANRP